MPVTVLDERLSFSTREACDAAGLSYRMVDYYVSHGAVWPSVPARGTGTQRGWTVADVERLARIGGVIRRAEHAGLTVGCAAVAAMWDQLAAGDAWTVTLEA
jgi:MerR HTH family regulatory protein